MAKSSKKNEEKNADFVKPKLKLGKGKQPAANAVDTTFKARTISVPQQSITADKDDSKPSTKRRLTYDDLISHLKHYSPSTRKDALSGLRELLEENTTMVQPNLLSLLHSSVKLISDEDATVRKALLTFFEWLFRKVPQEFLAPHSQTLLLFTTSAQTNIFAEVRIDAVRLLDLLLDVIPEQVVAGSLMEEGMESSSTHGRKVLDGYLSLLSASARMSQDGSSHASTSATVMLSPASKAIVLNSLSKFLRQTMKTLSISFNSMGSETSETTASLWYMRSSFSDENSYRAFCNLLGTRRESRGTSFNVRREYSESDFVGGSLLAGKLVDGCVDKTALSDLSLLSDEIERIVARTTAGGRSRAHEFISSLCGVLHPILVSTFLDCASSVFAPAQQVSDSEVQLLLSVFEIARCVFGALLRNETIEGGQSETRDQLRAFLAHLSVYHPFGEGKIIALDIKTDHSMQTMSLIYSELFSLLFASGPSSSKTNTQEFTPGRKRKYDTQEQKSFKKQKSENGVTLSNASLQALEKQSKRVRKYVVGRLRGQTQSAAQPMGQPLTTTTYEGLLPTVWWLLNEGRVDDGETDGVEAFNVVIEHATRIGSSSPLKKLANEFVMRLVLLSTERHYRGSHRIDRNYAASSPLVLWLLHLPKVLWEIGDKDPLLTELFLKFLICILQRRPIWLSEPSIRVALAARLIPFFIVQHPVKGRIAGPFGKLRWGYVDGNDTSKLHPSRTTTTSQSNLKALALDLILTLLGASSWRGPSNDRKVPPGSAGPDDVDDVYAGLRRAVCDAIEDAGAQERAYWTSLEGVMAQRRL